MYFKESFKAYESTTNKKEKKEILQRYPLIKKAIDTIGSDRCRKLKYIQKDIIQAIEDIDKYNEQLKQIDSRIRDFFEVETFVPCDYTKAVIAEIYKDCGFTEKPKGSVINRVFETESVTKYHKGRVTRGYKILSYK